MMLKRIFKVYLIIGKNFNMWLSPILTGVLLFCLRIIVAAGQILDHLFFWSIRKPLNNPIIIVGNPRSGTTFLHRFLIKQQIGSGSQLWQTLYPSILIQKLVKPFLPLMEKISPARHHSTEAHKTSLTSVETDDVSLLFRYLDGFFLYGFFLTFDDDDLFHWVDPKVEILPKETLNGLNLLGNEISFQTRAIGTLENCSASVATCLLFKSNMKMLKYFI